MNQRPSPPRRADFTCRYTKMTILLEIWMCGGSVTSPEGLCHLGIDGPPWARRQLRPPGAGGRGWEHNDLPGRFGLLRAAPLLADDVELRARAAAERAGEGTSVQFDRGKNLTAL